jgi:hypothetical protein
VGVATEDPAAVCPGYGLRPSGCMSGWWPGPPGRGGAAAARGAGHRLGGPAAAGRLGCAALALAGVLVYARVLAAGWAHRTTWVRAPDDTGLRPVLARLLPDDRVLAPGDRLRLAAWVAAGLLTAAATLAARARRPAGPDQPAARAK